MDSERKWEMYQRGGREEWGSPEVYWVVTRCGNMITPGLEDGKSPLFSHCSSCKAHHHYIFSLSFCLVHLVCTFSRLRRRQSALWALGEHRCEWSALPGLLPLCERSLPCAGQHHCWQPWGMGLSSAPKAGGKLKKYARHFSIQLMNSGTRNALSVLVPCIPPGWKEKTIQVLWGHSFPVRLRCSCQAVRSEKYWMPFF